MNALSSPVCVAVTLSLAALCTPGADAVRQAQTAAPTARLDILDDGLDARLDRHLDTLEQDGFSGHILLARQGEIILSRSFGLAARAEDRPFTADTGIDMASITKSFTGMIAAHLFDTRVVSPEDSLLEFFPDIPDDKANITLHQLATHSAGLPVAVGDDAARHDFATWKRLAFNARLISEPGTEYAYSNLGYSLLAAVIEQATGERYEDLLRDMILQPAGITQTGYSAVLDEIPLAHDRHDRPVHQSSWGGRSANWHLIGNGGMISTPNDLLRWRLAYAAGTLVSPQARDLAQTPHIREGDGAPSFYGYGMVVEDHPQLGRIYWHNGGSGGFTAHWRDYADHGVILIAASNSPGVTADDAEMAVTRALFVPD